MHDGHTRRGLVLALALIFAGCSRQSTDPGSAMSTATDVPGVTDGARADGLVHLALGDRAVYEWMSRERSTPAGSSPGSWKTDFVIRIQRDTRRLVTFDGNTYFDQRDSITSSTSAIGAGAASSWFVRQDRTGFYYRGGRTDGTTADFAFLVYPIRVGVQWARNAPYPDYRVDGHEVVRVQAGSFPSWRVIGIRSNAYFYDPTGWTYWYGAPGEIKHHFHQSWTETDASGNVLVTNEKEETFELVSWTPAGGT